jgi:voltage-gated potassium channel
MIGWRRWAHLLVILAAIVATYFVAPVADNVDRVSVLRGLTAILIGVGGVVGVVRQLRLHLDDTDRRVDGLIVSIWAVMVAFSFVFYTMDQRDPTQFAEMETRLDALYFTAATTASVGYGDVHAAGQAARALVLVQIMFNVVFIGTAVALLSSRIKSVTSTRAARAHTTDPKPE